MSSLAQSISTSTTGPSNLPDNSLPNNTRCGTLDFMGFKNVGKEIVEEVPYGLYVWVTEEDWVVQDDDGNVMNVFAIKGDRAAMDAIRQAAVYYGFPDGKPVFWSGRRRIDDEELENQQQRQRWGLEPDPLNYAALVDEVKEKHSNNG